MVSLYFHIPFCVHRCAYCDFNTYAGQESFIPAYIKALCEEIKTVALSSPERLKAHTLFFGGGTPSLLSTGQMDSILKTTRDHFDVLPGAEITLEANPGTVTRDSLRALHNIGFNRISLGVQSVHPDELRQLERIHDYYDVIEAVTWARQAGFDNLNLDLIFGLPEQTLNRWQKTVDLVLGLHPEHLSMYALTVEHGTPFGKWAEHGLISSPDPDSAADMYEWAGERLDKAGYEQYEISNWTKPGRECRHNLQYWLGLPYLGFGAGAHGYIHDLRVSNALRVKTYIERLTPPFPLHPFPVTPATVNQIEISRWVRMQETMMTGLRLTGKGVSTLDFMNRFGVQMQAVFGKEIDELIGLGLLEWSHPVQITLVSDEVRSLRLTRRGRLLGNQVFMRFVGE